MNAGRLRLLHLREQTEAAGERIADQRERFAALADPASAPRVVSAFNLFQTPPELAARMAALLLDRVAIDAAILEPSAGLGRLYRAVRDAGHVGPVTLVDQSPDCCRELYQMTAEGGATLRQGDFLTMQLPAVAGVIMNPPFKQGRDIKHILHAAELLTPGGRLVALCYDGPRQRARLQPVASQWHDLPPDTFKCEGTRVAVSLLVIDRPA